jgi:hypothetical protein
VTAQVAATLSERLSALIHAEVVRALQVATTAETRTDTTASGLEARPGSARRGQDLRSPPSRLPRAQHPRVLVFCG